MYLFIAIITMLLSIAWIWIFTEMNQAIDISEEEEYLLFGEGKET